MYIHTHIPPFPTVGGWRECQKFAHPSPTPKVNPLLTTKQQFSSYNPTEFLAAVIALAPFLF